MAGKRIDIVAAAKLGDEPGLTLGELCRVCEVHADWVFELVSEGVVEPAGRQPSEWLFSGAGLRRAHAALRLQRDLDLNVAGAALVLDLLDEIHDLRAQLQVFRPGFADDNGR